MGEDEDEDEGVIQPVRLRPALVASAVFTFVSALAEAVSDFLDTGAHLLAAHYVFEAHQRELHDQAVLEIETLTQGD